MVAPHGGRAFSQLLPTQTVLHFLQVVMDQQSASTVTDSTVIAKGNPSGTSGANHPTSLHLYSSSKPLLAGHIFVKWPICAASFGFSKSFGSPFGREDRQKGRFRGSDWLQISTAGLFCPSRYRHRIPAVPGMPYSSPLPWRWRSVSIPFGSDPLSGDSTSDIGSEELGWKQDDCHRSHWLQSSSASRLWRRSPPPPTYFPSVGHGHGNQRDDCQESHFESPVAGYVYGVVRSSSKPGIPPWKFSPAAVFGHHL